MKHARRGFYAQSALLASLGPSGPVRSNNPGNPRLGIIFTIADRQRLRGTLIDTAENDDAIIGAALVGSAATGSEDAWSDIDLMLQIGAEADPDAVADRWTAEFYAKHGAVHHLDVIAGGVLYRYFC